MPSKSPLRAFANVGPETKRARPAPLTEALREGTRALHRQAERSGIIHDVVRGSASRRGYALLLRNLLPAYREMERGLQRQRHTTTAGRFALPALYRAEALERDIRQIQGPDWRRELPLLTAGALYAERIATVATNDPLLLIGHAYVRYLGDLSGGQILRRILSRSLDLGPDSLQFYDFPEIPDIQRFKTDLKAALDSCSSETADADSIVAEAAKAFTLNIAVSEAVGLAAGDPRAASADQSVPMLC